MEIVAIVFTVMAQVFLEASKILALECVIIETWHGGNVLWTYGIVIVFQGLMESCNSILESLPESKQMIDL